MKKIGENEYEFSTLDELMKYLNDDETPLKDGSIVHVPITFADGETVTVTGFIREPPIPADITNHTSGGYQASQMYNDRHIINIPTCIATMGKGLTLNPDEMVQSFKEAIKELPVNACNYPKLVPPDLDEQKLPFSVDTDNRKWYDKLGNKGRRKRYY